MTEEKTKKLRKWYQKKRYVIPLGTIVAVAFLGGGNTDTQIKPQESVIPAVQQNIAPQNETFSPIPEPVKTETPPVEYKSAPSTSSDLSNDNYYTNVDGNDVHAPAYSNSVPPNATAQCRDGSYSFSQHRQGTCSHHGGVAEWL